MAASAGDISETALLPNKLDRFGLEFPEVLKLPPTLDLPVLKNPIFCSETQVWTAAGWILPAFSRRRTGDASVIYQRRRGFVPDRAARSYRIVVSTPALQLFAGIWQAHEPLRGQALGLGRGAPAAQALHAILQKRPLLTISTAAELSGVTFPTATAALERLQALGIVEEITGKARGRVFVYQRYLSLLEPGTEPL